jgi:hypothetical protein
MQRLIARMQGAINNVAVLNQVLISTISGLQHLTLNLLSPLLVPPAELEHTFIAIQNILNDMEGRPAIVGEVQNAYNKRVYSYLLSPQRVFVNLALPLLRNSDDIWPIYHVRSLPMATSHLSSIGFTLQLLDWPYVAVHPDGEPPRQRAA